MIEQGDAQAAELSERIAARRASITGFLRAARPRGRRLATIAIISSAIGAVTTAGPALGGQTFAASVADGLSLPDDAVVWRVLCLVALVVSIVAAISTNLSKSQDTTGRIAAAESANVQLEALSTAIEFGQISVPDAVRRYQEYLTAVPWVDDPHPATPGPQRPPQVHAGGSSPWAPPPGVGPADGPSAAGGRLLSPVQPQAGRPPTPNQPEQRGRD